MKDRITKRLAFFIISSVLMISFASLLISDGNAFTGCEEDCQKCHSLSNDEVNIILKKIRTPDAKILKIQMSPVKGLWEVAIENKGQRGLLYVDFSKKYLISGSIVEVNAVINKTRERIEELNKDRKISPAGIPLKDAIVLGSNTAEKKVIVFTDPD